MKWIKEDPNWRIPIKSWCHELEDGAFEQARNLARHPVLACHVALMPDCHSGFGMPIGGVIAARGAVLPSAVGVDIGCGMVALKTSLDMACFEAMPLRRKFIDLVKERVPAGESHSHGGEQEWEGFERCRRGSEPGGEVNWPSRLDRANLGTLGGGNHFIELQYAQDGSVWVMLHSGSRNLGYRVENHHQKIARKVSAALGVRLDDPQLAYLPADTEEGQAYIGDMNFALEYARENRRRMLEEVKQVLLELVPETVFGDEVNIHHNYMAVEEHFGESLYIHRKGATSARAGETGIIPGSMGTASYIVEGLGNPESFHSCSHGAGRRMSRTQASKTLTPAECDQAMAGIAFDRWKPFRWPGGRRKAKDTLDLSEAPQAYKAIDEVIAAERDLIRPLVELRPLAVIKG